MATVFTPSIGSPGTTPGERLTCRFLVEVFAGEPSVRIWHEVAVGEEHLDFVVFHAGIGLVVLEVRDVALEDVVAMNARTWRVRVSARRGGRTVERTVSAPHRQARDCRHAVATAMERVEGLRGAEGGVLLPLVEMVVLSRIDRARAEGCAHARHFLPHARQTLYLDDLDGRSRYLRPGGAAALVELLRSLAPFPLPAPLSGVHADLLGQHVLTASQRTLTVSSPQGVARRPQQLTLTPRALRWASEEATEPRLVRGVAGCGKTMYLVQRAVLRARVAPSSSRILFTCLNPELARRVRSLVNQNLEPSRHGRVVVSPIFEICGDLVHEDVAHVGREAAYYEGLVARAQHVAPFLPADFRFDILLVDEAQDFSPAMLRLVAALGRGGTRDITLAEDIAQGIGTARPRRFSHADVGIPVQGARSHRLGQSHRCTHAILEFAQDLAGLARRGEGGLDDGLFEMEEGERDGPGPMQRACPDVDDLVRFLVRDVRARVLQERVPAAEVGILYLDRTPADSPEICGRLREALVHEGIPVARRGLDLDEASVKLGRVDHARGLDFEVVYLLDLTRETLRVAGGRKTPRERHHRRLLFVGATRARERLVLLTLQ